MNSEKNPSRKPKKIMLPVLCVATVLVMILNIAASAFYDTITYYFMGADTTYDSAEAKAAKMDAEGVVEEIVRNSVVLLKNEEDSNGNTLLPLATSAENKTKVNLFGWNSVGWVIGGSGSGTAGNEGVVSLQEAMEAGNYEVNTELLDLYSAWRSGRDETGVGNADWTVLELPVEKYTDAIIDNAKNFSDVAIISIGRVGGEGNDIPTDMSDYGGTSEQHYLEINETERAMIEMVCENFQNVIVLINSGSVMELGWVDEYESIRSVLYAGMTGAGGLNALPEILSGEVNPSGHTADIYAYDLTTAPSFMNAGSAGVHRYLNNGNAIEQYIEYQEGIYVGYRYYETRGCTDGESWYAENVQYPFGYGLSYTSFDQTMSNIKDNGDGTLTVEVTVRNVGDVPGRDVVQLYYTAPYYDGGIEKSYVVLLDFAKTIELEPAQAQTFTFTFDISEMASFDAYDNKCYVLDAGEYEIKLMEDSHTVIDSKSYKVPSAIIYDKDNKRSSDEIAAVSLFADSEGDIVYLSRADWEGTWPKGAEDVTASNEIIAGLTDATVDTYNNPADAMPTTGAKNGLTLRDMTGLDYDDPKWDDLLDQMTAEELFSLVAEGGYENIAIESIDKPHANDLDGPQGINEANQSLKQAGAASYCAEALTGCSWDTEIAELMGRSIGKECLAYNVNGWYAPACNLHRSPFGGRTFEYYSEDPVLSGKLTASCVEGANEYGVYCYVKHFAVNETETNRDGLATWLNEQSLRELYLKPFEKAVKEGGTTAIMSSFNRLGTTWTGGSYELCTTVLRDEWGFRGTVVTDYYIGVDFLCGFMNGYDGLHAGNDLWLAPIDGFGLVVDYSNATVVNELREACHNILYTTANSNLVDSSYAENANVPVEIEKAETGMPLWFVLLIAFDVLYLVFFTVCVIRAVKQRKNDNVKSNGTGEML